MTHTIPMTLLACIMPGLVLAQDATTGGRRGGQTSDVRVYKLKHVEAEEVFHVAHEIINADVSVDARHNALIVRGDASEQSQIKALLEQLDIEPSKKRQSESQVVRLQYRDAQDIAYLLGESFPQRLRVTADEPTRSLLINGHDEVVLSAVKLLKQLDVPTVEMKQDGRSSSTLTVAVNLIRGSLGSGIPNDLPEHLALVGAALAEEGMGECKLLGHVMARFNEGEEFSAEGAIQAGDSGAASTVRIAGAGSIEDGGQTAEIALKANLIIPLFTRDENTGKTRTRHEEFGIETTSSVPLGDYLVLGAIPTRIEESDTVILVIRITR